MCPVPRDIKILTYHQGVQSKGHLGSPINREYSRTKFTGALIQGLTPDTAWSQSGLGLFTLMFGRA